MRFYYLRIKPKAGLARRDLVVVHALQVVLVDPQVGQSRPGDQLFRFEPQVDLVLGTDVRVTGMNHVSVWWREDWIWLESIVSWEAVWKAKVSKQQVGCVKVKVTKLTFQCRHQSHHEWCPDSSPEDWFCPAYDERICLEGKFESAD